MLETTTPFVVVFHCNQNMVVNKDVSYKHLQAEFFRHLGHILTRNLETKHAACCADVIYSTVHELFTEFSIRHVMFRSCE